MRRAGHQIGRPFRWPVAELELILFAEADDDVDDDESLMELLRGAPLNKWPK